MKKEILIEKKNKPIRVAQIMGKLWAGGVEMVVFNYYRAIDKNKVQFDFYYDADSTVEPPQELINMGARFYKIPPYQKLPEYLRTLRKHFKKHKYQIVHSHINTLSIFPLFAAWTCHIPVRIAHNHSVPGGNELKRNALKYFLRLFAKVFATDYFACSEKAGRWMFGNRTFASGKVFVVKNAVDFEKFRVSDETIKQLKDKYNLQNRFIVAHVGRFTYAKNHMLLLEVFEKISKMNDSAVLMLVGDGELHDDIVAKIHEKNLDEKVVLIGQVSDPEKYYRLADVMVTPSHFEGLSLTTIESQIAGVPVVVSTAIPEEAVISNGCKYVKLTEGSDVWAKAALESAECQVKLDQRADKYNIEKKALLLAEWYMKHSKV